MPGNRREVVRETKSGRFVHDFFLNNLVYVNEHDTEFSLLRREDGSIKSPGLPTYALRMVGSVLNEAAYQGHRYDNDKVVLRPMMDTELREMIDKYNWLYGRGTIRAYWWTEDEEWSLHGIAAAEKQSGWDYRHFKITRVGCGCWKLMVIGHRKNINPNRLTEGTLERFKKLKIDVD